MSTSECQMLRRSERELALRLETERKSKRELTEEHWRQPLNAIDLRTWYFRLVKLGIAIIDAGYLRRGPNWEAFSKSPYGKALGDAKIVERIEIRECLRTLVQTCRSKSPITPPFRIRRSRVTSIDGRGANVVAFPSISMPDN